MNPGSFTDIKLIRKQARAHLEKGAVTESYKADREKILQLLNDTLATETVCVLRYRYHYFMAMGINASQVATEFLEHSNQEQAHADQIAERIVQLGGKPNLSPDGLVARSHAEYVEGENLREMIKEDLVAERIAITSYMEMIRYIGEDDPTTSQMLKGILAIEEEHANDLSDFLQTM